jgi:WhiB family redox-sensing transcriptional regulator
VKNHPAAPGTARTRLLGWTVPGSPARPIRDWIGEAACATVGPVVFFEGTDGSDTEARQVCARCPVRAECRDHALAAREEFGVWGGLTEDERRAILAGQDQRGQEATA